MPRSSRGQPQNGQQLQATMIQLLLQSSVLNADKEHQAQRGSKVLL